MEAVRIHSKQDLLDTLFLHSGAIKAFGVNHLGIFGSFCKGTHTESSDVDLLVDFDPAKKALIISWTSRFF